MYESSWYFWVGSADYMADDGVSMGSDHTDAALFFHEVIESLLLNLHSPSSMAKELKPLNLLAIPCVSNTLLPSVLIKAIYKMYASLPKIQSSLPNYSPYMNFRHEKSTTFHWSYPSKTFHASSTDTWLKHTFPFCLDTPGTDKDMETKKVRWKANLICYHNSYAPILTHGIMQTLPWAKNTSG